MTAYLKGFVLVLWSSKLSASLVDDSNNEQTIYLCWGIE